MSEAIVQNMDVRSAVSAEEWAIRQDLAAAYRSFQMHDRLN